MRDFVREDVLEEIETAKNMAYNWSAAGAAVVLPMIVLMVTVSIVAIGSLLTSQKARQRHMRKVLDRLVELAAVMQLRSMPMNAATWANLLRRTVRR